MARRGVCKRVVLTGGGVSWRGVVSLGTTPAGKRDQRRVSAPTEAACEKAARALLARRDGNALARSGGLTVAEYLTDHWLPAKEAAGRIGPSTASRYDLAIRTHLGPGLGALRLDRLSPLDVQRFYADRAATLSPSTLAWLHGLLNQAMRAAVRLRLIPENPCAGVERPGGASPEAAHWSVAEARAFLAATETDADALLWRLLLLGGLRLGEALALRGADADADPPAVVVRRTLTLDRGGRPAMGRAAKTPAGSRRVELPASCDHAMRAQRDRVAFLRRAAGDAWHEADLLFPAADGRPRTTNHARQRFARLVAAAGLPPMTPHGCRHTHGTALMALGVSPRIVSDRLGHAGVQITMDLYGHPSGGMQREVAERLDAALGEVVG